MDTEMLHLVLDEDSPAMRWANSQADRIGARGHVGTHLDSYTSVPEQNEYLLRAVIVDCGRKMPGVSDLMSSCPMEGKALVLVTGAMDNYGYGTDGYFSADTYLSGDTLAFILGKGVKFIIIDSQGIGERGQKHIDADMLCETKGCHVIENAVLTPLKGMSGAVIRIVVDRNNPSTGKPCELYMLKDDKY